LKKISKIVDGEAEYSPVNLKKIAESFEKIPAQVSNKQPPSVFGFGDTVYRIIQAKAAWVFCIAKASCVIIKK